MMILYKAPEQIRHKGSERHSFNSSSFAGAKLNLIPPSLRLNSLLIVIIKIGCELTTAIDLPCIAPNNVLIAPSTGVVLS